MYIFGMEVDWMICVELKTIQNIILEQSNADQQ